jgi:hypothetical protein
MNSLFGDATSAMPTPQTLAEAESLFSGNGSPSGNIRSGRRTAETAIPDLDIDPPDVISQNGKSSTKPEGEGNEGIGGWISNMVKRNKNGEGDSSSGRYRRIGQDDAGV